MNIFRILAILLMLNSILLKAQKGSVIELKGRASYYAEDFHGKRTASGERFDIAKYTAAHRTLPFGTRVKVTNLITGRAVVVKINDRGPHVKTRIIDLSKSAARAIDLMKYGAARVSIEVMTDPRVILGPYNPSYKPSEVLNTALYFPGSTYNFWGHSRQMQGYGFQVGAFTDLISAREVCQDLIGRGLSEVYIQVGAVADGKLYRVMVYQFADRQAAENEIACLKSWGVHGFVRAY